MANKDYEGSKGGGGKGVNDGRMKGDSGKPASADYKKGESPNDAAPPAKLPQQGSVAE